MPYIPERIYEDKPDTFTPFVPLDCDNVVEVCEKQLNKDTTNVKLNKRQMFLYIMILLFVYFSLKRYKVL